MTAYDYQGHRSWNAWNVSLYISNEAELYEQAVEALKTTHDLDAATNKFFNLTGLLDKKTPDGAFYNRTCVKAALKGLEVEQLPRPPMTIEHIPTVPMYHLLIEDQESGWRIIHTSNSRPEIRKLYGEFHRTAPTTQFMIVKAISPNSESSND